MLSLAIKARIPIIRAHTHDLLNLPDILQLIAPNMNITRISGIFPAKGDLLWSIEEYPVSHSTYESLMESGRVMVLINQADDSPFVFDAGEVPVPKSLMEDLLEQVSSKKQAADLLPCFNGLTLKQMAEVIRLVQARDKSLSMKGVMQVRAMLTGKLLGLGHVDTVMPLYLCPLTLHKWVEKNKRYFLEATDERLIPRGVLMDGMPGVGKSAGAKHIANEFGVPLYRLDLGSSLVKWVGESEQNLARILSTLDHEEPSVLLIDEVEKVFAETEDEGVTSRLLSQMLWWLAEHKSRVLTVMTTNNKAALPPELYRAGRIDTVIELQPLYRAEAMKFAHSVISQFVSKPSKGQMTAVHKAIKTKAGTVPHANVIQTVIDLVKEHGWAGL